MSKNARKEEEEERVRVERNAAKKEVGKHEAMLTVTSVQLRQMSGLALEPHFNTH